MLIKKEGFPIITKSLQEEYEKDIKASLYSIPCICGFYGRACRRLENLKGANLALCTYCGLAEYGKEGEVTCKEIHI